MTRASLTNFALDNPLYVWIVVLVCLIGGVLGVQNIARLEDPPYPIKMAYVFTDYPGASAQEVEQEVTERIERSLQELPWIEKLVSRSLPGRSEVEVELKMSVSRAQTPQIWDELRRRVGEAATRLPEAAHAPLVEDDFVDVFGLLYAVTVPDGYQISTVRDAARLLQTELKRLPAVGKVRIEGVPEEQVYLDFDYDRLVRLGLPFNSIVSAIRNASQLYPAAPMLSGSHRLRVNVPLADHEDALADLLVAQPGSSRMLRVGDLAAIERRETDLPSMLIRHDGQRVFTLGVAIDETANVADIGHLVEQRLGELQQQLPVGMTLMPIFEQHRIVDEAVDTFLINLAASVTTVIAALCVFMGWRAGLMVGSVLLLTVMGSIAVMAASGIELQRISLGAMMIAMGMLVDNAIVVAEGMISGIQSGQPPRESAVQTVASTRLPLLAATVIGVAAFAPIGLSADSTGQFLGSLFQVCALSLMLSWVLAITIVPVLGVLLLKPTHQPQSEAVLYGGAPFRFYRRLIRWGIQRKYLSGWLLLTVIALSLVGFSQLRQGFFPRTSTPLFFVDIYLPQGNDIRASDTLAETARRLVSSIDNVEQISTWVGRGPTRFTMILLPERPDPAYAQLVVRVESIESMDDTMQQVDSVIANALPGVDHQVRRMEFTTGSASKIEARFYGFDASELRSLAERTAQVFLAHGLIERKTDWREQRLSVVAQPDPARARRAGVEQSDIALAVASNTVGVQIGTLRDGDKAVPLTARITPTASTTAALMERALWSESAQAYVPAQQVIARAELRAEDSFIMRRDRIRAMTVQANPPKGVEVSRALAAVRPEVEAIALPPGYQLRWGGEYEATQKANAALGKRFPLALMVMIGATLVLFGNIRQTLVIWMTVPLVVSGVYAALFVTGLSFTFPALLGLLSLIGILIKNCVILVEEIKHRATADGPDVSTLVSACVSRMRPVLLASGTTIAGMSPLLADSFFREMAVSIMGGLAVGSVLSLLAVPVYYALLFNIRATAGSGALSES